MIEKAKIEVNEFSDELCIFIPENSKLGENLIDVLKYFRVPFKRKKEWEDDWDYETFIIFDLTELVEHIKIKLM